MAIIIPPKPIASASKSVITMFGLLKKLSDAFTVRYLLEATDGPHFLVIWRECHAFLIRVAATSQELADAALSPSFFQEMETLNLADLENQSGFEELDPAIAVQRLVVFPNVHDFTIDQIERLRTEQAGVAFLGLKQTPPERFAHVLEAMAGPSMSEPMMAMLRERFDAGSLIHQQHAPRRLPLRLQAEACALPPLFLDVHQEMLAKLDVSLPPNSERLVNRLDTRLVTGPAGSGKSIVLLHRALFAARLNRDARILVLTHNRPLNQELKRRAETLMPTAGRIEWCTFFQWAMKTSRLGEVSILFPKHTLRRIEMLMLGQNSSLTPQYVAEEIGYLRDLGIASFDEYLELERSGRLMALTASRRKFVWNTLESYRASLKEAKELDWHEVALQFVKISREQPSRLHKYDFIFIDEAQFFAKVWFQPVLAALRSGGQLFLAADPTQGFLKRRDSWTAAGIDIRGRSSRLSIPYRSTRAILEFAMEFLCLRAPLHPELGPDLDPPTGQDLATIFEIGEAPVVLKLPSFQDVIVRLVEEIVQLHAQSPHLAGNVLVLDAQGHAIKSIAAALRHKLGNDLVAELNAHEPQPQNPFCLLSIGRAATGLEAAVVFVLGVDPLLDAELDPRLDATARAELAADNTRLLYMACTRAAHRLVIFSHRWPR